MVKNKHSNHFSTFMCRKMSNDSNKIFYNNDEISNFSPLLKFFYYDLSVSEINEKLLNFDPKYKKPENDGRISRLEEIVGYAVTAIDEALLAMKNLLGNDETQSKFARLSAVDVNEKIFIL